LSDSIERNRGRSAQLMESSIPNPIQTPSRNKAIALFRTDIRVVVALNHLYGGRDGAAGDPQATLPSRGVVLALALSSIDYTQKEAARPPPPPTGWYDAVLACWPFPCRVRLGRLSGRSKPARAFERIGHRVRGSFIFLVVKAPTGDRSGPCHYGIVFFLYALFGKDAGVLRSRGYSGRDRSFLFVSTDGSTVPPWAWRPLISIFSYCSAPS
jgi:hypothetical protein